MAAEPSLAGTSAVEDDDAEAPCEVPAWCSIPDAGLRDEDVNVEIWRVPTIPVGTELGAEPAPERVMLGRRAWVHFGRRHAAGPEGERQPDIELQTPRASRKQALALRNWHGQVFLMDLGSTHGTFLGRQRLRPKTPQEWRPGVSVYFADKTVEVFEYRPRGLRKASTPAFQSWPSISSNPSTMGGIAPLSSLSALSAHAATAAAVSAQTSANLAGQSQGLYPGNWHVPANGLSELYGWSPSSSSAIEATQALAMSEVADLGIGNIEERRVDLKEESTQASKGGENLQRDMEILKEMARRREEERQVEKERLAEKEKQERVNEEREREREREEQRKEEKRKEKERKEERKREKEKEKQREREEEEKWRKKEERKREERREEKKREKEEEERKEREEKRRQDEERKQEERKQEKQKEKEEEQRIEREEVELRKAEEEERKAKGRKEETKAGNEEATAAFEECDWQEQERLRALEERKQELANDMGWAKEAAQIVMAKAKEFVKSSEVPLPSCDELDYAKASLLDGSDHGKQSRSEAKSRNAGPSKRDESQAREERKDKRQKSQKKKSSREEKADKRSRNPQAKQRKTERKQKECTSSEQSRDRQHRKKKREVSTESSSMVKQRREEDSRKKERRESTESSTGAKKLGKKQKSPRGSKKPRGRSSSTSSRVRSKKQRSRSRVRRRSIHRKAKRRSRSRQVEKRKSRSVPSEQENAPPQVVKGHNEVIEKYAALQEDDFMKLGPTRLIECFKMLITHKRLCAPDFEQGYLRDAYHEALSQLITED